MTLHNYRSRQVHQTLNGVNPSSRFRDRHFAKSGPNLCQIWQVLGPWASPYRVNGHITMTVHKYTPRQFHRTSNGENLSSGYRDMGSASLAAASPTVTTIPLQPGGLRGKNPKLWFSIAQLLCTIDLQYLTLNVCLCESGLCFRHSETCLWHKLS